MKNIKSLFFVFFTFLSFYSFSQAINVKRVNPTNWYVGMKNKELQLMLYGDKLADCKVTINYPGVNIIDVKKVENPNYLFLELAIAENTQPGVFTINFEKTINIASRKRKAPIAKLITYKLPYELKTRTAKPQHITSADFVYLIMPDRFSNGDPTNDKFATMADTASDRKNPFLRHGGDLTGVINHLDYIKDLGATAIWLNPVIENDQPQTDEGGNMRSAYHGYGFTDQYNVDRRLGGNTEYLRMIDMAHQKGNEGNTRCGVQSCRQKSLVFKRFAHEKLA
jgi:neopullulanase